MTSDEKVDYWLNSAEKDKKSAELLFKHGHYDWSLFIWHLVLEKTLKARLVKSDKQILLTHNLVFLSEKAEIKLSEEELAQLSEIQSFNLEARYDNYKFAFFKKATKKYAQHWTKVCQNLYQKFKSLV